MQKFNYLASITLLSLIFTTIVIPSFSQILQGKVVDNHSGDGLPGVHIIIKGSDSGTVTNQNGNFSLDHLVDGTYTLQIRSIGYETKEIKLTIPSDDSQDFKIVLNESIVMLKGASVESFSITGGLQKVGDLPGSAYYITPKQLEKFSYNDINRVLRNVPGVNIQDEEGFGLRPNIGLRGTGSERSSKITLMEDGILIAPAPYVAPAAYYFPTVGRMQGIEVRKGSSQVKYGPYTTGGAINLISTTIPDDFFGRLHMFGGSYGNKGIHAFAGDSFENIGFLVETYQAGSNGFKELDNRSHTGFHTEDYVLKLRINTSEAAQVYQSFSIKAGRYFENANETYLGLTDADFLKNPYYRYSASQLDNIKTDQTQLSLTHFVQPLKTMKVSTSLYSTRFARNWYKLDKVKSTADGDYVSISKILGDPFTYNQELQILKGLSSMNDDALRLKANNRSYWARGIQTLVQNEFRSPGFDHVLEFGYRYHQDQIDRYQWLDVYRMDQGTLELTKPGEHGTESNRVESARASAGFIQYTAKSRKWTLSPGLRFEDILMDRLDYGKTDPGREGLNLTKRKNHVHVIIPGIGMDYDFSGSFSSFLGVHKGFSPPGSREGTLPESSINYELGARYSSSKLKMEAILYYNDYDNLLGADLAASGGTGSGDLYNGGKALVYGNEFLLEFRPRVNDNLSFPIGISYTFTQAEFRNAFESEYEPWGSVEVGDKLPYIAPHQLALSLALEHNRFNVNLSTKYSSSMRTIAGQGAIEKLKSTDESMILDFSSQYNLSWRLGLFASVYNLTNATYIVSRRPAGVRPGLPRSFSLGIKSNF